MDSSRKSIVAVFGASGGIGLALTQALAGRGAKVFAGSRGGSAPSLDDVIPFAFDLTDEASISEAANLMRETPPDMVLITTGVLTLADGAGPERTYRKLNPRVMEEVFRLNTIGPALIAKHMLPLMPRDSRCVFAALSARVGSISDNSLGGWHSYRASKAALNMLIKNFAIELSRTHKHAVVVGLHPGTVDSSLSKPFQTGLPDGQLTVPAQAAANLLSVLDSLTPDDTGKAFDWRGEQIPA